MVLLFSEEDAVGARRAASDEPPARRGCGVMVLLRSSALVLRRIRGGECERERGGEDGSEREKSEEKKPLGGDSERVGGEGGRSGW